MQATPDEHNHRPLGLLTGLLLVALAIWFATAPRLQFGPSPQECAAGLLGGVAPALAWMLAAAAAGLATAVLLLLLPHGRITGGFGAASACVLAAGLPLAAGALGGFGLSLSGIAGLTAAAVVVTVASSPLLRDRGLGSLLLVPLLVAAPVLTARWHFQAAAAAAAPLLAVRSLMPEVADVVALQLGDAVTGEARRQLLASLRPPWGKRPPAVVPLAWPADVVFAEWLLRMGVPALRFDGRMAMEVPDLPLRQLLQKGRSAGQIGWAPQQQGQGVDLWLRSGSEFTGGHALLFTEAGCASLRLDDHGASLAGAEDHRGLRQLLASVPSASWIRILVVSPGTADSYGWVDLTKP